MNQEESEEEDGVVRTEVLVGDKTEVEFHPPRGTNRMPDDRSITTGAVRAEADKRDPGQTNRFGPPGGAKPKRPRFELPFPAFEMPTRRIQDPVDSHRVLGQGR